jgi:deoxyribonuclease V
LETFNPAFHRVAGADVSYNVGSDQFYAGVVVLELPQFRVIEESVAVEKSLFPYIPGLLSFREAPVLLRAFERLTCCPDVIIFDGQGIAHPRKIGIASHIGLFLDWPSIGCAKRKLTGTYDENALGNSAGSVTPLRTKRGRVIGSVVRTKDRVKPVFVSPGHKTDIATAVDVVLKCCRGYKLPEPTRLAHNLVNRVRKES